MSSVKTHSEEDERERDYNSNNENNGNNSRGKRLGGKRSFFSSYYLIFFVSIRITSLAARDTTLFGSRRISRSRVNAFHLEMSSGS
jgi:hypothetical protein